MQDVGPIENNLRENFNKASSIMNNIGSFFMDMAIFKRSTNVKVVSILFLQQEENLIYFPSS